MRIVQIVLGIFLIAFILLGNSGLRVFKHSCEQDGILTSYILPPDDHCQEKEVEELPSCCQKEATQVSCCDSASMDDDDCCTDEVDIYTVDFDFFQDNDLEIPHFVFEENSPVFCLIELQPVNMVEGSMCLRPPPDSPAGKELLILNQVFRI